jgi:hypothetical protein
MSDGIQQWSEIADRFRDGLILGNGASIAIHPGFHYQSLLDEAQKRELLDADTVAVFKAFGSNQHDFELVMRRLWYARQVNEALKLSGEPVDRVDMSYQTVRRALIETVRATHVAYENAAPYFDPIARFAKRFRTVLSLNYDLILYWALLYGNREKLGSFRDCFHYDGSGRLVLDRDWTEYRDDSDTTLCFYPHGNLVLARTAADEEVKLQAGGSKLLDAILKHWESGEVLPIFVCEGTTEQKQRSISGSSYLRQIESKAFDEIGESIVIYGWSMGPQEQHISDRIVARRPKALAISVRNGNEQTIRRAKELFAGEIEDLVFFDAQSPGAWANSDGSRGREEAEIMVEVLAAIERFKPASRQ